MFGPWADPGFWIGGGHVLTSGRSVVDMWPKTLYNVGRLGGAMAPWPPPWIRPCTLQNDSRFGGMESEYVQGTS